MIDDLCPVDRDGRPRGFVSQSQSPIEPVRWYAYRLGERGGWEYAGVHYDRAAAARAADVRAP